MDIKASIAYSSLGHVTRLLWWHALGPWHPLQRLASLAAGRGLRQMRCWLAGPRQHSERNRDGGS